MTATQFKPVADLYEVTVPSGRSTTFTKDAAEASDCRVMGWSVQEYVKLERYQAAMLQGADVNSPDGWVACSERMPMDGFDVLCASEFDGPGDWRRKVGYWHCGKWVVYGASWTPTHWMPLPAAPQ
ncbi:TPA: DUF551 domain-containing protein [Enterobacter hormaechei]|nr:DUF551 domain-containing protein [Enterobacter hormaechei]MBK4403949.1 DUF551 domain-containing protein [Enterobacter hormaechei]HAS1252621.1 DUF551 domain-containing protein [Enterobacter hormaechei subsp. steigerwaltii]HAS1506358.1 DUF551 domain-containing protein [Enterobacter hormaechei]HCJ7343542.1 DUF551 domain-containing protein [Enterobacter hormaechei subsp. xiangfangensis]